MSVVCVWIFILFLCLFRSISCFFFFFVSFPAYFLLMFYRFVSSFCCFAVCLARNVWTRHTVTSASFHDMTFKHFFLSLLTMFRCLCWWFSYIFFSTLLSCSLLRNSISTASLQSILWKFSKPTKQPIVCVKDAFLSRKCHLCDAMNVWIPYDAWGKACK